jgi:hypothetical protein
MKAKLLQSPLVSLSLASLEFCFASFSLSLFGNPRQVRILTKYSQYGS